MRDALITLKHSVAMEGFNLRIKQIGIPLTLSAIGRNYVFDEWRTNFSKYLPYQISGKVLMGNSEEVQTPKGLFHTGDTGLHLSYYIGNYKGGRNESFMYGAENEIEWYDYDLVSAYTTSMATLSLPCYPAGALIEPSSIEKWTSKDFLTGYLIVNGTFKFPTTVKYPSIPCYIDETTTIYPLEGSCLLTGPEYLLAKNQGCVIDIKSIFYIPPKTEVVPEKLQTKTKKTTTTKTSLDKIEYQEIQPFHSIIKEIQKLRRENKKGTILNLLYKEMGNSIYGNLVRAMSNKKSFDSLTGQFIKVPGTELSNPILASWTTAFIRSVVGECLHNIDKLGGKVVSVTTDGFITNVKDLESKILNLPCEDRPLYKKYCEIRRELLEGSGKLQKRWSWSNLEKELLVEPLGVN
jgi:hypothetical protein